MVIALSLFLIGGLGLAIDTGSLYQQAQRAQAAADAAATAAITSMFQGVDVSSSSTYFSTAASFTCTATDARLPCQYARMNGFGSNITKDNVTVSFPVCSACGYEGALSNLDSPNQVQVTITRNVSNSIIQMLGAAATTPIRATAIAAIVTVQSPAPIIITDPSNSGTLSAGHGITICGGPSRSIEVNSSSPTASTVGSEVDLSHAGPNDPGDCSSGTGADFGVFGGEHSNPGVKLGTTGHYISKASPIQDPFAGVPAPPVPSVAGSSKTITAPTDGCQSGSCTEYSPGTFASLDFTKQTVIFKPGVYYVEGGGVTAKQTNGGNVNNTSMCSPTSVTCPADTNTGTGMLIYDTGASGGHTTGGFNFHNQNNIIFQGPTLTTTNLQGKTVPGAPYYDIVFWEDRQAQAQTHSLGQGNGCFSVLGTIYITNTLDLMQAHNPATQVQTVDYGGTPCSNTVNHGSIVVGQLQMSGNSSVSMNLWPYGFLEIRQVALVGGGPHP
jgi:Flp pilus assembly protein TadG